MSAMPAYDYNAERAYEHDYRRRRDAQPDISVVPGGARRASQAQSSSLVTIAKIVAVALVVIALLGVARVTLSAQTVTVALETRQLSSQIETARSEGSVLEVNMSTLSNPTRIKTEATALGMAAPSSTTKFDLSGDVVVTDASGNLSLSGSMAACAALAG